MTQAHINYHYSVSLLNTLGPHFSSRVHFISCVSMHCNDCNPDKNVGTVEISAALKKIFYIEQEPGEREIVPQRCLSLIFGNYAG